MKSAVRGRRVVQRLLRADLTLAEWEQSLGEARATPSSDRGRDSVDVMQSLVANARKAVHGRLEQLHLPEAELQLTFRDYGRRLKHHRRWRSLSVLCVRACRSCGRALGVALRSATSLADAETFRVLYGALRAFEKQLWLLDPRLL